MRVSEAVMKQLAKPPVKPHPAKFTDTHLEEIVKILGGNHKRI